MVQEPRPPGSVRVTLRIPASCPAHYWEFYLPPFPPGREQRSGRHSGRGHLVADNRYNHDQHASPLRAALGGLHSINGRLRPAAGRFLAPDLRARRPWWQAAGSPVRNRRATLRAAVVASQIVRNNWSTAWRPVRKLLSSTASRNLRRGAERDGEGLHTARRAVA